MRSCIGLMRMNRILEVDFDDRLAVVEAGVTNLGITKAVEGEGFFYAPDPSSQLACMIGGNVNMNSGGAHCLKYGVTANNLLGLTIVTLEGEVVEIGGAHLDAAGYDWLGLLTGSEGQLGIVTEVTVRILRGAGGRARHARRLQAAPRSPAQRWTPSSASGIIPVALEFMDRPCIHACEAFAHAGYPLDAEAMLIIEVEGSVAEQDDLLGRIKDDLRALRPDQPEGRAVGRGIAGDLEGPQGRLRRGRPHQPRLPLHGRHHPDRRAAARAAPHRRDERRSTG